jgi:hypothetical protein
MALIKCNECGNDVSDKAPACPKCGAPVEKVLPNQGSSATGGFQQHFSTIPPVNSGYPQQKPFVPPSKKKKSFIGLIISGIVLFIVIIAAIIIANNPNAIPGVSIKVNTPKPVVITSRADGMKSGLLKQRETVYVTVQNQGGAGKVLVNFYVYQDGHSFSRTKSIYLDANESRDLDVTFDEVTMLGGQITYDVNVQTQ